ncbi:hypothetical protein pdam_00007962 [Pocillopora damicornis]|uniref:Uncharacterized protein n=1 Tax=Pocillopora damicornis TaxID=46731 RepID=A0A3M6UF94_POCDA|nr:hypothetical protein pdam_00007962 [Pocillopora damicornis]
MVRTSVTHSAERYLCSITQQSLQTAVCALTKSDSFNRVSMSTEIRGYYIRGAETGGSQPPASRTFVPLCLPIPTLHGISPAILPHGGCYGKFHSCKATFISNATVRVAFKKKLWHNEGCIIRKYSAKTMNKLWPDIQRAINQKCNDLRKKQTQCNHNWMDIQYSLEYLSTFQLSVESNTTMIIIPKNNVLISSMSIRI